jgi:hypothetical protein
MHPFTKIFVAMLIIAVTCIVLGIFVSPRVSAAELNACVKKNGQMYLIGGEYKQQTCHPNDTPLTFNTQGPQGEKGDPGDPGQQGEPGTPGANGQDGADGQDGAPGADGLAGSDGVEGAPGSDGQNGADGAPGADGATGPEGPPGENATELHLFDGSGQDLGILINGAGSAFTTFLPELGVLARFLQGSSVSSFQANTVDVFFTELDCSGTAFSVGFSPTEMKRVPGRDFFAIRSESINPSFALGARSVTRGAPFEDLCENGVSGPGAGNQVLVEFVDLPFSEPLVFPFAIESVQ